MSSIEVIRTNSSDRDFVNLIAQLDEDLSVRYVNEQMEYDQYNHIELVDTAIVVYKNNKPIGCGCFKYFDYETVEVKRMFITLESRGKGISKIILKELEGWANELGFSRLILETGKKQSEAIGLYEKYGFGKIKNYGQYISLPNSVCFEKRIDNN